MGPKQAMNLNVATATTSELKKAESVLFRARMKTMSGSPLQKQYAKKYWEVREALDGKKYESNPAKGKWMKAKAIKFLGGGKIQVKV